MMKSGDKKENPINWMTNLFLFIMSVYRRYNCQIHTDKGIYKRRIKIKD